MTGVKETGENQPFRVYYMESNFCVYTARKNKYTRSERQWRKIEFVPSQTEKVRA